MGGIIVRATKVRIAQPIFIVSIYRTGSTLLRNILDSNPFIAMLPEEAHLWNPYPWRTDITQICKDLKSQKDAEEFIEMLFSDKLYGPFWKKINRYPIDKKKNNRTS